MLPEGRVCRMCDPGEKEFIDVSMSPRGDMVDVGSPPSHSNTSEENEAEALSPQSVPIAEKGEIEAFVDDNLDRIVGEKKDQFDHRQGAVNTFRRDPVEFERWKKKLKPKSNTGERQKYSQDYQRRRGNSPRRGGIPRE